MYGGEIAAAINPIGAFTADDACKYVEDHGRPADDIDQSVIAGHCSGKGRATLKISVVITITERDVGDLAEVFDILERDVGGAVGVMDYNVTIVVEVISYVATERFVDIGVEPERIFAGGEILNGRAVYVVIVGAEVEFIGSLAADESNVGDISIVVVGSDQKVIIAVVAVSHNVTVQNMNFIIVGAAVHGSEEAVGVDGVLASAAINIRASTVSTDRIRPIGAGDRRILRRRIKLSHMLILLCNSTLRNGSRDQTETSDRDRPNFCLHSDGSDW